MIWKPKRNLTVSSGKQSVATWIGTSNLSLISYSVVLYNIDVNVESIYIEGPNEIKHQICGLKTPTQNKEIIAHGIWKLHQSEKQHIDEFIVTATLSNGVTITIPFRKMNEKKPFI